MIDTQPVWALYSPRRDHPPDDFPLRRHRTPSYRYIAASRIGMAVCERTALPSKWPRSTERHFFGIAYPGLVSVWVDLSFQTRTWFFGCHASLERSKQPKVLNL